MSLMSMLNTSGVLQRGTNTKDASGGFTKTWAPAGTYPQGFPCEIQPASGQTLFRYEQRQLRVSHTVYFADDVGALEGDRFVSEGRTFKVMGYQKSSPGHPEWPCVMDVIEEPTS